jgi:hypothetical protein
MIAEAVSPATQVTIYALTDPDSGAERCALWGRPHELWIFN